MNTTLKFGERQTERLILWHPTRVSLSNLEDLVAEQRIRHTSSPRKWRHLVCPSMLVFALIVSDLWIINILVAAFEHLSFGVWRAARRWIILAHRLHERDLSYAINRGAELHRVMNTQLVTSSGKDCLGMNIMLKINKFCLFSHWLLMNHFEKYF